MKVTPKRSMVIEAEQHEMMALAILIHKTSKRSMRKMGLTDHQQETLNSLSSIINGSFSMPEPNQREES